MTSFQVIVAATLNGGIGYKNTLPWPALAQDMKRFKNLTIKTNDSNKKNAVIMGRNTWESLPARFRPLPNRWNIIVSSTMQNVKEVGHDSTFVVSSLQHALEKISTIQDRIENVFIIGGARLYDEALQSPYCSHVWWTNVYDNANNKIVCDTFLNSRCPDPSKFDLVSTSQMYQVEINKNIDDINDTNQYNDDNGGVLYYQFLDYRRRHEEYQYLDVMKKILTVGVVKDNERTKVGTKMIATSHMKFNLRNHTFPLFTTKRVFWRGIVQELLWFLSGSTDAKILQAQNIHIWDGNSSAEYIKQYGFTGRREGDIGPGYGFQWKHCGAEYVDCDTNYQGQGIDQIKQLIDTLKNNPDDRRMIVSAWNVKDIKKMNLAPCHSFFQFFVTNGELSCQVYCRSQDWLLGTPFNIGSYALLTYMIAHVTGLKPGDLIHIGGDCHIYNNHVAQCHTQLSREPRPFPQLYIKRQVANIDDFKFEDFVLESYDPHSAIQAPMAI